MNANPHSKGGSVLIVVLWATLGLVSVALLFGHSMVMTYRGADNDVSAHQADQAIEGAIRYVETLLVEANTSTPGLLPDPTLILSDSIPVGEATFFLLGRSATTSDGSTREFGLVDEASKINLTIDPNTTDKAAAYRALAGALRDLPGVTAELADALVDWQDEDDDLSDSGAESETYLRFDPAYGCKNAPLESLEELALLNGATRDILYGEDTNMNGVLDPNEDDANETEPNDNADGILDAGLLEYVTIFNRESNKYTDSNGTSQPRIDVKNVQQARPALTALLKDKGFADARAQQIIDQAGAGGQQLTSPLQFYVNAQKGAQLTEAEFNQFADALTVKDGDWLYGLVNVNTASEAVLACLPGMDASIAATLAADRNQRPTNDSTFAWVAASLDEQVAGSVGPFITGRSSAVTADIAAVGRHGRGFRREKVVIDMSKGTPRIVYRRNLAPLGWPLGIDIRDELAQLNQDTR